MSKTLDDDSQKLLDAFCNVARKCIAAYPWNPVDMVPAPEDRRILAVVAGEVRFVQYGKTSHVPIYGFCLADQGAEEFDLCKFDLWMEMPSLPKLQVAA